MSTPLDGLANTIERELAKSSPTLSPVLTTGIVDVHHADGACDLEAFKAGGGVAFIHKATEGGDFIDKAFARVLPTLKPAGLLAGGVSWGVFRTQLERQREELGDLRREVRELRTTVQDLTTKLAVVADRHDREHAT